MNALRSTLYTAVLSDVLDSIGLPNQTMRPFVRPLSDDDVMFGRARTGLFMQRYGLVKDENPYDIEIELIDDLKAGDIAVFACNGPVETIAPWGELLTTAAMKRGANGFVTDGLVRDTRAIRKAGFPVFHGGIRPVDSAGRSKMMLRDVPVDCAGVRINPGDLIFGDVDGIVIIPKGNALEIIEKAKEKIYGENKTRDEIISGSLLGDIYKKYGIL